MLSEPKLSDFFFVKLLVVRVNVVRKNVVRANVVRVNVVICNVVRSKRLPFFCSNNPQNVKKSKIRII